MKTAHPTPLDPAWGPHFLLLLARSLRGSGGHPSAATRPAPGLGADPPSCVEADLEALVGVLPHARHRAAAGRRLGWDGLGGASLQEAGDAAGMGRERVRQVVCDLVRACRAAPRQTPALDLALGLVTDLAPCLTATAEEELHRRGFTRGPFRIEGLLSAALVLGRAVDVDLRCGPRWAPVLLRRGTSLDSLLRALRRLYEGERRWGCASLRDVERDVTGGGRALRVALSALSHVRVVGVGQDRLALVPPSAGNQVWRLTSKLLSIARETDADALHAALRRDADFAGLPYGPEVLLGLCQHFPGVLVEGGRIFTAPTFRDPLLPPGERVLVDVLRASGGAMRTSALMAACQARGMPLGAVRWYTRHPFLRGVKRGFVLFGAPDVSFPPLRRPRARARGGAEA